MYVYTYICMYVCMYNVHIYIYICIRIYHLDRRYRCSSATGSLSRRLASGAGELLSCHGKPAGSVALGFTLLGNSWVG